MGDIDLRLRPPAPDIDGNSELSTGAVERHELLRSWETPTFTHWCSLIGGLLSVWEPPYRPDLPPPIGDPKSPDSQPGVRKSRCLPTADNWCLLTPSDIAADEDRGRFSVVLLDLTPGLERCPAKLHDGLERRPPAGTPKPLNHSQVVIKP